MEASLNSELRDIVGPAGCLQEPQDLAPFLAEWRGLYRGVAELVLLPANTDEVSAVLRLCSTRGIGVVPQGGNTGLLGGGVPDGGIVVATARLDRVRGLDPINHTMTVEAGCVLADLQRTADEAGFHFPLSLGAEGSCQIGGNLSTNAGGVQVLAEVPLAVHQGHGHHGQPGVGGRAQGVSRQDAEAAAIGGDTRLQAHLHGEVGDGAAPDPTL
jgi:hypothetical protein